MFNKNKKLIERLKAENKILQEKLNEYNSIKLLVKNTAENVALIAKKVAPGEQKIIHVAMDAVEFAKKLKLFPIKQQCGGYSKCRRVYMIPVSEIDSMASVVFKKELTDTGTEVIGNF